MTRPALLLGIRLDLSDAAALASQAGAAEAAAVDLVLLDDPAGEPGAGAQGLDPIEAAAFVAALAPTPALLVTAAATHAEPFHLSNRLSSLDWGSRGRAGWWATVDPSVSRARAYGVPAPDAFEARREAAGVVDVVRRLWDSWEDDALVADTATGRFLDADRLHYTDTGDDISVRGPALMPRPVQGQVPVFASPDDGIDADVWLARERHDDRPVVTEVDEVADVPDWQGRTDGVVLRPRDADAVLEILRGDALKRLAAAGVWQPASSDRTLRERLGLRRPVNRFAGAVR